MNKTRAADKRRPLFHQLWQPISIKTEPVKRTLPGTDSNVFNETSRRGAPWGQQMHQASRGATRDASDAIPTKRGSPAFTLVY